MLIIGKAVVIGLAKEEYFRESSGSYFLVIMAKIYNVIDSTETLRFLVQSGKIDLSHIQDEMDMAKRKELLAKHKWAVTQGQDGRWSTYLPDREKGRKLVRKSSLEKLEDAIVKYYEMETENPTIKNVFTEWNDRKLNLKKISPATHLRYEQIFNRHYKEFGKKRIKSVSTEDIEEFLEEQIPEHDLTAKAFSNLKTVTRGFLKRAKKRKLISFSVDDVFEDLDVSEVDFRKVTKEDYEEVFSDDEMDKIVSYLSDNLDAQNLAILLIFATGIRVGEAVTLKNADFVSNTFRIRRTETRYIEGKKYVYRVKEYPKSAAGVRESIIPEGYGWIVPKIKTLNPFGEYVFVKADGSRMTTNCIRKRLERVCAKLGIYKKSPHKIRKTYGSILLDNNIDKRLVIEQMGHADVLCTENHYHRNRRSIEKVL